MIYTLCAPLGSIVDATVKIDDAILVLDQTTSIVFTRVETAFGSTFQCCGTVDESIENIILAFDRNIEWCWPAGDD